MNKSYLFFFLMLGLLTKPLVAQVPTRPVIAHQAPTSVVAGQPLRIVARVSSSDPVTKVQLYLAQSDSAAPVNLTMHPAGAGVYSVQVPPSQFAGVPSFRYYIDARTEPGAISETNWMTVQVIGQNRSAAEPAASGWKRPVLIGAGAVVAVGAGVAIAGGGGGGGGDPVDPGVDPADQVLVRTASDQLNDTSVILPQSRVVDVAGDLAGRSITRVRVQLDFNGVDGGQEEYEVSYNGRNVLSGRTGANISEQVDVQGSADTQVVIRVLDSAPVDGVFSYSWNVTVTYFVE